MNVLDLLEAILKLPVVDGEDAPCDDPRMGWIDPSCREVVHPRVDRRHPNVVHRRHHPRHHGRVGNVVAVDRNRHGVVDHDPNDPPGIDGHYNDDNDHDDGLGCCNRHDLS